MYGVNCSLLYLFIYVLNEVNNKNNFLDEKMYFVGWKIEINGTRNNSESKVHPKGMFEK